MVTGKYGRLHLVADDALHRRKRACEDEQVALHPGRAEEGDPLQVIPVEVREEEGELPGRVPASFPATRRGRAGRVPPSRMMRLPSSVRTSRQVVFPPTVPKRYGGSPARNSSRVSRALQVRRADALDHRGDLAPHLVGVRAGSAGNLEHPRTSLSCFRPVPQPSRKPSRDAPGQPAVDFLPRVNGPLPHARAVLRVILPVLARGDARAPERESCGTAGAAPRTASIRRFPTKCNRGSAFP